MGMCGQVNHEKIIVGSLRGLVETMIQPSRGLKINIPYNDRCAVNAAYLSHRFSQLVWSGGGCDIRQIPRNKVIKRIVMPIDL